MSGVRRRVLFRAAAAGAAGVALAGCGRDESVLRFWQFYSPRGKNPEQIKWFEDLVRDWNRQHRPKVELKYVPPGDYSNGPLLQTAFAAGEGPDIFVVSPGDFLRYYNGGVLKDLTPYLSPAERADFHGELMTTREVDGRIYALPMGGGPMAMYYSVRAFEEAGLSESDIPTSWEGLLETAARLNTPDRFGVLFETSPGYYQNFTWYPFLWMAGGDVVSGFDSAATRRALGFWQEFVRRGWAPRRPLGSGSSDIVANLASGYCAMQNAGMNGVADLRSERPDFEYGVFPLPAPEGQRSLSVSGGWAFAANARGRDPDAAARFCVWAIGSQRQDSVDRVVRWCTQAQTYLPYRWSAIRRAEQLGAYDSGAMRRFRYGIFPGTRGEPRFPPEVQKAVSDALQECQLADSDPAEQARLGADRIAEFLRSYSGPLT